MLASPYLQFPSLKRWKQNSFVGTKLKPKRRDDRVLLGIDRMVSSLSKGKSPGEYAYRLGGLFFSTLYWINNHKINRQMDSDRRGAIMRMNLTAANRLAKVFKCPLGGLAAKLQEIYGISMSLHGETVDFDNDPRYMNFADRERYRVIFRDGKAYRFSRGNIHGPEMEVVPWNSANMGDDRGGIGYVMSMSNELFVGAFGMRLTYHSTFMGGVPVQCAGMIDIKEGTITRIKNDSGHYKPQDEALAKVLRHLKTVGVDIRKIEVQREKKGSFKKKGEFDEGESVMGDLFLKKNGNWETILKTGSASFATRQRLHDHNR